MSQSDSSAEPIEGWDEMTEQEREEEIEQRRRNLRESVNEEFEAQNEAAENAMAALREAGDDEVQTHTVELTGGIEVDVIDTVPGELESKAANVSDDDTDATVGAMIDVMCHVIQTEGFDQPAVWQQYHAEFGTGFLAECAMAATEPYYERSKKVADSRQFRRE